MATEVLVPLHHAEAAGGEDRLHLLRLTRPDLHQHMAFRCQVRGGVGRDCAIGVKAVVSACQCKRGVKVPDIRAEARNIA